MSPSRRIRSLALPAAALSCAILVRGAPRFSPRRIGFVDDLPKTLTGKIRRIELRQLELERAGAVRA